jgi:alpha-L-fucosidase
MTLLFAAIAMASSQALQPIQPIPSNRQLAWQKLDYYAFVHFGPNTFTGEEWGDGQEDPNVFNPTQLDCRQWARTFKEAGMKMVVITAKHHDGFCLWPSSFSTHSVKYSKWRNGKGDVLKELSEACKEYGLKFGVYLSPWDRNHSDYGTPKYNEVFKSMLQEVLTQYGEVHEVWFDGANGEGPNGKRQVYDWPGFIQTVRKHAPNAVIFSDVGPDIRWVGNENGFAGTSNWSMLNVDGHEPGSNPPSTKELNEGDIYGDKWIPAECDVSIRPGWFWREVENDKIKSVDQLMEIYFRSVGSNSALLLNVPADSRGLIHERDVQRLLEFKAKREAIFSTELARRANIRVDSTLSREHSIGQAVIGRNADSFWSAAEGNRSARIIIDFDEVQTVGHVLLQEPISMGQRVMGFRIIAVLDGKEKEIAKGTTIGNRRIVKIPPTEADSIIVVIDNARATVALSSIEVYAPGK